MRFAHALICDALYEELSPPRRLRWHRLVGEVLGAAQHPDPDAVAYHFRSADDARAAEWLVRAGERAQRAYAWLAAAERFEAALALLESDEVDPGGQGWLLVRLALRARHSRGRASSPAPAACRSYTRPYLGSSTHSTRRSAGPEMRTPGAYDYRCTRS